MSKKVYGTFVGDTSYPYCIETTKAYFGTEYEIESIKDWVPTAYAANNISITDDGSLRNNGKEFITVPLTFEDSLKAFDELRKSLKLGDDPYSYRTSTHVHLNVLNMTTDKLRHMTLLYALLEPVFFEYAGQSRKQNIHCVPLNYTLLPKYYGMSIEKLIGAWSKYTAFNLVPVKKYGTVEFRHLSGTPHKEVYERWLTMIHELWAFSMENSSIWLRNTLYSGASWEDIRKQVIPSSVNIVPPASETRASLIDVKLAFV